MSTVVPPDHVAGLVLAGGRSSRMGGDKPFLTLGGETLLERAVKRLLEQVTHVAINANSDLPRFSSSRLTVICDRFQDFRGPLAGFDAGLHWARETSPECSHLLTVAVDTPFFPGDLLERLQDAVAGAPDAIAVPATSAGTHRVFALIPLNLADDLQAFLETGGARVQDWLMRHDTRAVGFAPLLDEGSEFDPFFNINTPEDLQQAETWLAANGGL